MSHIICVIQYGSYFYTQVNNMNRVPAGMKLTLNISRNIKPNSKKDPNVVISLFNTAAQTAKYIPSLLLKR